MYLRLEVDPSPPNLEACTAAVNVSSVMPPTIDLISYLDG